MQHLTEPTLEERNAITRSLCQPGADPRTAPSRLQLDDQPSWTNHDPSHSKFDHTVSLGSGLMRELGHVDRRGIRRVGVRIVELAPGFPASDGTRPNWPRLLAYTD